METPKLPDDSAAISIGKSRIEISLGDAIGGGLTLVSPPFEDISEMTELGAQAFSVTEHAEQSSVFNGYLERELEILESRLKDFPSSVALNNRIANIARRFGSRATAMEASQRAAALANDVFHNRKLAISEAESGSRLAAEKLLAELADKDSGAALYLASLKISDGDFETARDLIDMAVRNQPDGHDERIFQGALCLLGGDPISAITYFRIAIEDRPRSSTAHCNLGFAYLLSGRPDKAYEKLRRAIALDPLNRSALLAFADVGHSIGKDGDVISYLRNFVEFEQKDAPIWGRLSRSLLKLGLVDDCIHALKRQGAISNTVAVWNNLGVAYAANKQTSASIRALNYALSMDADIGTELLVARNAAHVISSLGKHDLALSVTSHIVEQDVTRELASDSRLGDLYIFHIYSLRNCHRSSEADALSKELIGLPAISTNLARWIVNDTTSRLALERSDDEFLSKFINTFAADVVRDHSNPMVANNVAFALAEIGMVSDAERVLHRYAHLIHRDPYLTATAGLIQLRKGRMDRGEELYREAAAIARRPRDRTRILQKLNLEMGRHYATVGDKRATSVLKRAASEKGGERALATSALKLLNSSQKALPRKPLR